MKYRKDFVTNSSSTSFAIWGIEYKASDISNNDMLVNKIKEFYYDEENIKGVIEESPDEYFYSVVKSPLTYETDYNKDYFYIGFDVEQMKDNETLKEFKQRIVDLLADIGIITTIDDIYFHTDCYYNG